MHARERIWLVIVVARAVQEPMENIEHELSIDVVAKLIGAAPRFIETDCNVDINRRRRDARRERQHVRCSSQTAVREMQASHRAVVNHLDVNPRHRGPQLPHDTAHALAHAFHERITRSCRRCVHADLTVSPLHDIEETSTFRAIRTGRASGPKPRFEVSFSRVGRLFPRWIETRE